MLAQMIEVLQIYDIVIELCVNFVLFRVELPKVLLVIDLVDLVVLQ